MIDLDIVLRRVVGFNMMLRLLLERRGASAIALDALFSVLPIGELALLVGGGALFAAGLRRAEAATRGRRGLRWPVEALYLASAGAAVRLLVWLLAHPGRDLLALAVRWDHLVFCLLTGCLLGRLPVEGRKWVLAALSVAFVYAHSVHREVGVMLVGCLAGFAALRWAPVMRPGGVAAVQGTLLLAVALAFWVMRSHNGMAALAGWGMFSFVLFRHVSFVVEAGRGAPATLANYLCYLLFYPSCVGAVEVYPEFLARNLRGDGGCDYRRGVGKVVRGAMLAWLALQMPIPPDLLEVSTTFALWRTVLLTFVRSALFVMGAWSTVEGGAFFLGIELRPNFTGVLVAANPSEFWRAWRGTMTNWLIQYVYIPLGGNRRHRTFNIFAAFVVSTAWHCVGIPFLHRDTWTAWYFVPIVAWGAVNFAGVATQGWVHRRWPPVARSRPAAVLARAVKIAPTMCFGSLTVTLLGFSLGGMDRFGAFLRTLLGLGAW